MCCWAFILDNTVVIVHIGDWLSIKMISATDMEELLTGSRKYALYEIVSETNCDSSPRQSRAMNLADRKVNQQNCYQQQQGNAEEKCWSLADSWQSGSYLSRTPCTVCGRRWVCQYNPKMLVTSHLSVPLPLAFGSWMLVNEIPRGSQAPGQSPGRVQEIIRGSGRYQHILLLPLIIAVWIYLSPLILSSYFT